MIRRIGVVVPARDEAEHVDACLRSIAQAARGVPVAVHVVVVADGCLDDTAERARRHRVEVIETPGGNVGAARATGARWLLSIGVDWVANTDADSEVPVDWLATHLDLARRGADVVVGTVRPRFADLTSAEIAAWRASHDGGQAIGHVHGANLGVHASAYRLAGGYRALPEHEDTDLVERLRAAGCVIAATDRGEVETSGRHVGRTPGGYARYLRDELLTHAQALDLVNPVT